MQINDLKIHLGMLKEKFYFLKIIYREISICLLFLQNGNHKNLVGIIEQNQIRGDEVAEIP